MSKPFTLHGTPTSGPVYKVALALSLLGKQYGFKFVDFDKRQQKSPEHLKFNRFGEVPALEVKDGPVLVQSAAILEWLAEKEKKFDGGGNKQEVKEWLHWTADKLAPPIYRSRAIARGRLVVDDAVAKYFRTTGEAALDFANTYLTGRDWLVGASPSIADIDLYPVLALAPQGNFDLSSWSALVGFVKRFEALPGWGTQNSLTFAHDND